MKRKILRAVYEACDYIKSVAPFDTGNLRDTIEVFEVSKNEYEIRIGGELAPYAVYTNETWVAPRWHGRKNPNEHWINLAVDEIVRRIAAVLGGEISDDNQELIDRSNNKNYWDSAEGQERLRRYGVDDTENWVPRPLG